MKVKELRIIMFFSELVVRLVEAITKAVKKDKRELRKDDDRDRHISDYKTF